jgi:hypothetical protein
MELVQSNRSFDGEQRIYRFNSISLQGESKFGIYLPAQALAGQACPTPTRAVLVPTSNADYSPVETEKSRQSGQ